MSVFGKPVTFSFLRSICPTSTVQNLYLRDEVLRLVQNGLVSPCDPRGHRRSSDGFTQTRSEKDFVERESNMSGHVRQFFMLSASVSFAELVSDAGLRGLDYDESLELFSQAAFSARSRRTTSSYNSKYASADSSANYRSESVRIKQTDIEKESWYDINSFELTSLMIMQVAYDTVNFF